MNILLLPCSAEIDPFTLYKYSNIKGSINSVTFFLSFESLRVIFK